MAITRLELSWEMYLLDKYTCHSDAKWIVHCHSSHHFSLCLSTRTHAFLRWRKNSQAEIINHTGRHRPGIDTMTFVSPERVLNTSTQAFSHSGAAALGNFTSSRLLMLKSSFGLKPCPDPAGLRTDSVTQ